MNHLLQDLRYAMRTMRKAPGFAAVVICTMGLGVGANITIFSLINEVMLRPLPIADQSEVMRVYTSDFSSGVFGGSSYPDYMSFKESSSFEDMATYSFPVAFNLGSTGVADRVSGSLVSGNFFNVLGVNPAAGRLFQPSDDLTVGAHPVVVLSHGLWSRQFASNPDVVGENVVLNGATYTVIGVTADGFTGLEIGSNPDLFIPITMYGTALPTMAGRPILEQRGARWLRIVGRLRDGVTQASAQSEVTTIMAGLAEEFQSNMGTADHPDEPRPVTVLSVRNAAFGARLIDETADRAQLLLSVVGLVLLIACANIANLLLARGTRRQSEISVRLAIGAGRGRIIRQLMTESVVLGIAGGLVGIGFAAGLMQLMVPLGLSRVLQGALVLPELSIDGLSLAFAAGLSILTALVFGVLPALKATNPDLVTGIKGGVGMAGGHTRYGPRNGLVVLQVAASLVLLVAAGRFIDNARSVYNTDLGFEYDGVAVASLDVARQGLAESEGRAFFDQVLERVRTIPGVRDAAYANFLPVSPAGMRSSFGVEDLDPELGGTPEINMNNVTPGYFRTLGIPLIQGRDFSSFDTPAAPLVVVVNSAFAQQYWPNEEAVGKHLYQGEIEFEVVGLAGTNKYRAVREDPLPYLYFPMSQSYQPSVALAIRTSGSEPTTVLPAVRDVVRQIDPTMPVFNAGSLRDQLGSVLAQEQSIAVLFGVLGVLALSLAAVGIYGVMSYTVAQRTREIGVRSALGARGADLVWLVVGGSLKLSLIGIAAGVLASFVVNLAFTGMMGDVQASSPVTFAGVVLGLGFVSVLASLVPARRAASVEPLLALRAE